MAVTTQRLILSLLLRQQSLTSTRAFLEDSLFFLLALDYLSSFTAIMVTLTTTPFADEVLKSIVCI